LDGPFSGGVYQHNQRIKAKSRKSKKNTPAATNQTQYVIAQSLAVFFFGG